MDIVNLVAQKREITGKKVHNSRKQGKVPAVLYGNKIETQNLFVDQVAMDKAFDKAGESTLVDLAIDGGQPIKVLIQEVALDHLTNRIIHADFHQVNMKEKIHTEIIFKFIGEAPAVKELGGNLVTNIHAVKVECLPQYLVHEIEIDLSGLKSFDDDIKVKDVKVPEGIEILHDLEDTVAAVQPPRSEKEMSDLESKPEEKAPEVVAEPKAEEKE